jgi:transcription termination/antitermination protein NusG
MAMQWYVVHTYSGYENRAKEMLEERIEAYGMQNFFGEIMIPTEDVEEITRGKKGEKKIKKSSRKFFPGYLLVHMEMDNDAWHLVRNTPRITGFIGGKMKPMPIPTSGVEELISKIKEGKLRPTVKMSFEKGDSVVIMDGPFSNFNGVVEEVKPEKVRLKVLVSIFGRQTPIEIEYSQVKKIN